MGMFDKVSQRVVELITDPSTGRASESKIWLHPAKAVIIWAFAYLTLKGGMTSELIWAFSVPLFAHEAVSRIISMKISPTQSAELRAEEAR
jgi:hypothetical protein